MNREQAETPSPPPLISVVIPTFNRRESVASTVLALQQQRFAAPFEIIVVVDGSTDGTADRLLGLQGCIPLRVLQQANQGASAARNNGARAAHGEILLFLDDDMEADPDLLTEHARCHVEGNEMVVGHMPLHPDSPAGILRSGVQAWAEGRLAKLSEPGSQPGLEDLLTGQLSIGKQNFTTIGGFDTTFTEGGRFGNEDLDFGYRVLRQGLRVVFNPKAVSWQRYLVSPEAYLRQRFDLGTADVLFMRKHCQDSNRRLSEGAGQSWRGRFVWRYVTRIPAVGGLARALLTRSALQRLNQGSSGYLTRRLFAEACAVQYWCGVARAGGIPSPTPPRVLAYHSIRILPADSPLAPYTISPEVFSRQIDTLLEAGFRFLNGDELLGYLERRTDPPPRSVLLTFDDCYVDLADTVLPILRERRVPALAFAVSGEIGGVNSWDRHLGAPEISLLDGQGLKTLAASGIEVGAHSHTHRMLPRVSPRELGSEVGGAAATIRDLGLPLPRFFSYPHGECNQQVMAAVKAGGMRAAFTVRSGTVARRSNPLRLPRIEILPIHVGTRFALRVAGAGRTVLLDGRERAMYRDLIRVWEHGSRIQGSL